MRQRILTAALGIPLALAAILANSVWPVGVVCLVLYALGSLELTRIYTGKKGGLASPSPGFVLGVAGIALIQDTRLVSFGLSILWAFFALGIVGAVMLAIGHRKLPWRILGSFYLMAPLLGCVLLQRACVQPDSTPFHWSQLLFVVLPLWAGDTAAIFVGKAFGKHPLAPQISPGKTWEGAIANFICCVAVAVALCPPMDIPLWIGAFSGILSGILGQLGDLLESKLKRSSGLKDSGSILPGHGGILDRIDSLLLSALPVATVLRLLAA